MQIQAPWYKSMGDIYLCQYFISWLKLQAKEVIVMASGAAFGVCHTVDVMMSWLGCLVLMDTVWLWFFIKSVGKQAAVPVPFSKRLSQMTVLHQKEMMFSHGHMLFGISSSATLCCPLIRCIYSSWTLEFGKGLKN